MARLEAGTYVVVNAANTSLCFEAEGWSRPSLSGGQTIHMVARGFNDARIWVASYRADGTLQLVNRLVGRSLDVEGAGTHVSGADVILYNDHDGANQQFDAIDANGTVTVEGTEYPLYFIKMHHENLNVAAESAASSANVCVRTPADDSLQKWAFMPVPSVVSGAIYELVNIGVPSTQLAIACGWNKQNGNTVGAWNRIHDYDDQKWLLENTGAGWTLYCPLAERYAVILNNDIVNNQPIISYTATGRNMLWKLLPFDYATIDGARRPVVAFGAINQDNYYLTRAANGNAILRPPGESGGPDGISTARWALVPAWTTDPRLPAPYSADSVSGVDSTSHYDPTAPWGDSMQFAFIPTWMLPDGYSDDGSTSFQIRTRERRMALGTSTWGEWGNWSDWEPAPVTRQSRRSWLTNGLSVSIGTDSKLAEVEYEVRTCVVVADAQSNETLRVGGSVTDSVTCYPVPNITLNAAGWSPDGIRLDIAGDYPTSALYVSSIAAGGVELLAEPVAIGGIDEASSVLIPQESLLAIPADGVQLDISYQVGTDQKARLTDTLHAQLALAYDAGSEAYAPTVTEADGYLLSLAVEGYENVRAWVVMRGEMTECRQLADGSFQVAYPFNEGYQVFATGWSGDGERWFTWHADRFEQVEPRHVWNFGSEWLELVGYANVYPDTSDSISAVSSSMVLDSRPYETVSMAPTRKHSFNAKGAVVKGHSSSTRDGFGKLAGTHAIYRSPAGDIVPVAVTNVDRNDKGTMVTEITVQMVRESE